LDKMDWGNCVKCGIKITDKNFGDCIGIEENIVCADCSEKHLNYMIEELETFRKGKGFNGILDLRKKILWVSEQMGNWMNNATGTIVEGVTDYNEYNIFELQLWLLDNEITIVENLLKDDDGFLTRHNPKMEALRKELLEHHSRVLSYIDKEEFFEK